MDGREPKANLPQQPAAAAGTSDNNWVLQLTHWAALAFLTLNTVVAAYRARSDPWTLAFVLTAYAALMLFFWSLRAYEAAATPRKARLKVLVLALAVFLVFIFAYKVSLGMPLGFAAAIWVLAGATATFGFYGVFFMEGHDTNVESGKPDGKKMTGKNQLP